MKIEVNGELGFEELISLASYSKPLFNNGLEEKRFPIKDRSKRIIDVKLLSFSKKDKYHIPELIKEKGFRSLFIEELLSYSYLFPDKQKQFDIFSLDHFKYGNHGQLYPCLKNNDHFFGRQIELGYIDNDIDYKKTRFAVTKLPL